MSVLLSLLLSGATAAAPPSNSRHTPVVNPPHSPTRQAPSRPAHPAARPAHAPLAPPTAPAPTPQAEKPTEPTKGTATGLPLPRFVSLRSEEVRLRRGPGMQYAIDWVYTRRDLPVEVEREFDVWRLVQDQDGIKGWVNQATLNARRTVVVAGEERVLRAEARDDASAVARLKPGVIARLRSCEGASSWCDVSVQDYRGWLRRSDVWGISTGEAVQ